MFCDISDMEAVCSDILDDTNSISRVKRQTQQRRRRLRKNGKNRNRRIKILFKMLGKFMSQCKKVYSDLGSLIGNTQCGNFRIFQPLRFYAKSILVILNLPKAAILTILAALGFEFFGIFDIPECEIILKIKICSLQNC